MTSPDHLSRDQISDLLAGVLPAAEAMAANAHLAGCAECGNRRDELLAVTARLGEEATEPIAMPADVAAALTAAIDRASAERSAGVRTLEPVRRPPARQSIRWLSGAAAAVVVAALGVVGLRAISTGDNPSSDAASNGAGVPSAFQPNGLAAGGEDADQGSTDGAGKTASQPTSAFSSPPPTGSPAYRLPRFESAAQVASQARRLAAGTVVTVPPRAFGCAPPLTGRPTTVILFEGSKAVLSIIRTARLATVYDCATGTETLFTGGY